MQLTSTNRSSGLIALINPCSPARQRAASLDPKPKDQTNPRAGLAGLVAFARRPDPIPSRTRPSTASAPMVLCLKTRESRWLPGQPSPHAQRFKPPSSRPQSRPPSGSVDPVPQGTGIGAGWSSPVARQAHNLKAAGSNPAPATKPTPADGVSPAHSSNRTHATPRTSVRGAFAFAPCEMRMAGSPVMLAMLKHPRSASVEPARVVLLSATARLCSDNVVGR